VAGESCSGSATLAGLTSLMSWQMGAAAGREVLSCVVASYVSSRVNQSNLYIQRY
jgi:hypothetical protein